VTDWADALASAAGDGAALADAYGVMVLDVGAERWLPVLTAARDSGLDYFDWLSAVDELEEGFSVVVHIADVAQRPPLHLLIRTKVPRDVARLASATSVFRGAGWHERETHEMFGITFEGHPNLEPLLLPDGFEGTPLRKDFMLAARAAKAWPGAKEPGEADTELPAGAPSRRRMQPPGVPDPSWGPRPPRTPDAPQAPAESDEGSPESLASKQDDPPLKAPGGSRG
jgi:NADH-quinone oxidoreductase subunit C